MAIRCAFGVEKGPQSGFCLARYGAGETKLSSEVTSIWEIDKFQKFRAFYGNSKYCFIFDSHWDALADKETAKEGEEMAPVVDGNKARHCRGTRDHSYVHDILHHDVPCAEREGRHMHWVRIDIRLCSAAVSFA
jgi:hypothetical protein